MLSDFSDSDSDSFVCLTQEFPILGFKIPIKSQIHRHFPIPIAAFVFCRYEVSNPIKSGLNREWHIDTQWFFFFALIFFNERKPTDLGNPKIRNPETGNENDDRKIHS